MRSNSTNSNRFEPDEKRLQRTPKTMRTFRPTRRCTARRGAAVVELALVMPLLGGLLIGICEVGQALRCADILAESARNACAYASRPGGSSADAITEVQTALTNAQLPT